MPTLKITEEHLNEALQRRARSFGSPSMNCIVAIAATELFGSQVACSFNRILVHDRDEIIPYTHPELGNITHDFDEKDEKFTRAKLPIELELIQKSME